MNNNSQIDVQYRHFMVGEKPYCMWDFDIQKQALSFLDDINPNYFLHLAKINLVTTLLGIYGLRYYLTKASDRGK